MMHLKQSQLDWLLAQGVTTDAIVKPRSLLRDEARPGDLYIDDENAWWNVRTNQVIADHWCLGDPLDGYDGMSGTWVLTIHETPLAWLKDGRRGIVVIDWTRLFDMCRDIPRISVPASLRAKYDKHMRPTRLPKLEVRP